VQPSTGGSVLAKRPRVVSKLLSGFLFLIGISGISLLGIMTWCSNKKLEERKFRVLVPLYASSQEYLQFLKGEGPYLGPYSRKVSSDVLLAVKKSKDFWFSQNRDKRLKPDKIDFFPFPEGYDDATYRQAFAHAVKIAKANGFEIVGSIGHVTSSTTKAYGALYAEEGLPLVLPLATATDLASDLTTSIDVPAVLRLPPTNAKQANVISDFLLDRDGFRVLVAKDLSNPTYSNDLVEAFRARFVRSPFSNLTNANGKKPSPFEIFSLSKYGRILGVVPAGGDTGQPFAPPAVQIKSSDAILLFGMTEFAVETLMQAWAQGLQPRFTILTDGAVDEYLLPRLNGCLRDFPASAVPKAIGNREIYLAHPIEERLPRRLQPVFADLTDDERYSLEMTHAQYVVDAVYIYLTIVNDEIVAKRASRESKVAAAEVMRKWAQDGSIPVMFDYDRAWAYSLDVFGNSLNRDFHLFKATLSGSPPGSPEGFKGIEWEHDESFCPTHKSREKPTPQPSGMGG
jgi:hypothetical protein